MRSLTWFGLGLLSAAAIGGDASAQTIGFCGNYQQTSSNAGDCPTCTLMIADNPEIQRYFIEANNGWSAEAEWVEGDASVAEGKGQWSAEVGGAYAGKEFDILLSQQGRELTMAMTVSDGSIPGTIEGRFICTDPPATPEPQQQPQNPQPLRPLPNRG